MVTLAGDSTTATSSTNPAGRFAAPLLCQRHGVGETFTSGMEENPFRRFIKCPTRKVSGCDYFRWVDDELTPHYLASVQRLKQQKEALETQLQCKAELTEVLYERLRLKDDEMKSLRRATPLLQ
ncbi:hypothetical protein C2S52_021105 [Perilla frutescens var. hirtella]|nr:hypothetical protein C2S52_021105 [Perilla frutescens var. hirtella]